MRACILALCGLGAASGVNGQSLTLAFYPSQPTAEVGDTVTWTLVAQLDDIPVNLTLFTVIGDIRFEVDHGGDTGVSLSNNQFAPLFDTAFFPAANGTVSGDAITGASGAQPLFFNQPSDDSNPLSVYSYDMLITDGTPRTILSDLTVIGQMTGAYTGSPFPTVFFYQDAAGNPGSVPFAGPPLLFLPTLTVIPAPISSAVFGLVAVGAFVRRR